MRATLGNTGEDPIALQHGDAGDAQVVVPEVFTYKLAASTKRVEGKNIVTPKPGMPITITTKTVKTVNPSARVVDFKVFKDETKKVSELSTSIDLGMDREGDIQLNTSGAVKLKSNNWFQIVVGGSVPALKKADEEVKKVLVTKGPLGKTEPVLKGETFLMDLTASIVELNTFLNGMGILTPQTTAFITKVQTSIADGAPYLSNTLESE